MIYLYTCVPSIKKPNQSIMNTSVKKIISYFMIILVLVFTIIALLGIWEIISLEDIIKKMFVSLMVVFAAAAVILFIFSVLIRDQEPEKLDKPD
ncbi:MAG: hypothetical protein AMS26_12160 [Bacteroides sp. SM23_62]|nr:MAG: hypothetical protein AMS26_12160 [Bacteroides sp. SM23_62]